MIELNPVKIAYTFIVVNKLRGKKLLKLIFVALLNSPTNSNIFVYMDGWHYMRINLN